MSLSVLQRPQSGSGNWNAVRNPIVYLMLRQDFSGFSQINDNGGDIQVQYNGVDITSGFTIDDNIYIFSNDGLYDLFADVTAIAFSGGNTLITVDSPYLGATAAFGYVNNETTHPSYRVEVEVYNIANEIIGDVHIYSTTPTGDLLFDISETLKSVLSPDFEGVLTGSTENFDELNLYVGFYIKYREVWTGSAESQTDDVANQFFAIAGAMQIPSLYGGNLFLYTTFVSGTPKGLFLTKLDRPKIYRGFPFLISIIVGDLNAGSILNVIYLDINGNSVGTANSDNVPDIDGAVYSFDITKILAIPDSAKTVLLTFYNLTPIALSVTVTCDIIDPCENPVLLIGRNSLGGILTWLFDGGQEYNFDYGDQRKAKRLVLFTEHLNINQWESLQDFITLGEVYKENILELTSETNKTSKRIDQQLYVVDTAGNKIGVVAIPTKNRTLTSRIKHQFEVEIEYPEEF